MDPEELMQAAIDVAKVGIGKGQSPFGCSIAIDGELIAACHNSVWLNTDITAHAEINALRAACRIQENILLESAMVASTCEPCPMCMSALHWARVNTVYFGATIEDAGNAGFNELTLPASEILRQGGSKVQLNDGVLRQQCAQLFANWKSQSSRTAY